MLHELARYAEQNGLAGLPGYKAKAARWLIVLADNGQYVDAIEQEEEYARCPDLGQPELASTQGKHSQFLLDTAAVVTGYGAEADDPKQAAKHTCFVRLLHEAASACPELELCARALEDERIIAGINDQLKATGAKPTDKITFRVGLRAAPEMSGWRAWWDNYRGSLRKVRRSPSSMVCLLSGELVEPAATHDIKIGLSRVGGQPSGSALVSFDKDAFGSYTLEQSANAACSAEAAALYATALNDLVRQAPRPMGGAYLLHWYEKPILAEDDLFGILGLGNAAGDEANARLKARQILTAVRSGTRPELTHNRYYVLEVSGAGGRAMVRDWFNDDFVRLVECINQWFGDLELVWPRGNENGDDPKLAGLLVRLVDYRPGEKIQDTFDRIDKQLAPVLPKLWRAILQGTLLPDVAAQKALVYARSRLLRGDEKQDTGNLDRLACMMLKAWLVRKQRQSGSKEETQMEPSLNKEHPSPAYQAGRLLAVLAGLQQRALGDVNAGVVQRYFAAASTTPSLVLGRLIRNAQYHLQKLDKGPGIWYEKQIGEIVSRLGTDVPATLNLEGQTLFALGYYQQRTAMFSGNKIEMATTETSEGGN